MADGQFTNIKRFDKDTKLQEIRELALNPLITYTRNTLDPKVREIEPIAKGSFKEVRLEDSSKRLIFKKHDSSAEIPINLGGIIPEPFDGITVKNNSITRSGIKTLTIKDSALVSSGETATIDMDWARMVPANQERVLVNSGKPGDGDVNLTKIKFAGNTGKVSVSGNEVTLTVPNDPTEFTAQVGTGTDVKPVKKFVIKGNTTGSVISDDGTLQIQVPESGGGGGVTTGGNFQGFFNDLGELIANVGNPQNGKSYAFVRDEKYKDKKYYTPYMYVNNGWTEAPVDPSITYEGISTPTQGVFSIKPDAYISVDQKGQMDLSKLRFEGHFIGFFDSGTELEAACPNPVVDRSWGYYKTLTGAYAIRAYVRVDGENKWFSIAPHGVLVYFEKKDTETNLTPIGGIKGFCKNDMLSINDGVVTVKNITQTGGTIQVQAIDKNEGKDTTKDVSKLKFQGGVFVDMMTEPGTALIENAQRLITYNSTWEEAHKDGNYLGNIFYDQTSGTWMGYSVATGQGDLSPKWTRIAHRDMSSEVKGLSARLPVITPVVTTGPFGDNRQWEHTGWSYVESAFDVGLTPENVYKNKGLYIQTYARKGPSDQPSDRPSKRVQVGFIDDESGEVFTRIQDDAASSTDPFWKPWSKVSMSQADLDKHNTDQHAHRSSHKYYRVYSIDMEYSLLRAKGYYLYDKDMLLMADSHGIALNGSQEMVLPYDGEYTLSGCFTLDQLYNATTGTPSQQWKFEVVRKRTGVSDARYQFVYTSPKDSSTAAKDIAMTWKLSNQEFKANDKLVFYFQGMGDSSFATNYPNVKFVPVRSYIVIEDSDTVCGSRIADSFRRTFGVIKQRGDSGISLHRRDYTAGKAHRQYGSDIISNFEPMTKV